MGLEEGSCETFNCYCVLALRLATFLFWCFCWCIWPTMACIQLLDFILFVIAVSFREKKKRCGEEKESVCAPLLPYIYPAQPFTLVIWLQLLVRRHRQVCILFKIEPHRIYLCATKPLPYISGQMVKFVHKNTTRPFKSPRIEGKEPGKKKTFRNLCAEIVMLPDTINRIVQQAFNFKMPQTFIRHPHSTRFLCVRTIIYIVLITFRSFSFSLQLLDVGRAQY